jgi:hypothetical protein
MLHDLPQTFSKNSENILDIVFGVGIMLNGAGSVATSSKNSTHI